eukprot:scaffold335542_cov21-Prasinocladus_malaysianus.AAC.1
MACYKNLTALSNPDAPTNDLRSCGVYGTMEGEVLELNYPKIVEQELQLRRLSSATDESHADSGRAEAAPPRAWLTSWAR